MGKVLKVGLCIIILASGCTRQSGNLNEAEETPLIAVSIYPQQWFVDRISGGLTRTLVLAGQGQNPHNYEPSPRQIKDLAKAAAWIVSGSEFEESLRQKIEKLFPALPVIDGTAGVVFREIDGDSGDEDHLSHNIDRHSWLGLEPAKILAGHVKDLLIKTIPDKGPLFTENYNILVKEINDEFESLRREIAPLAGRNVFVYHPSFGYFLDEFGIRQQAVETGSKSPGPRDLSRMIALAKEEKPAVIFVQAQFPAAAAKTVADAVNAQLVWLDPLAPDWLANIRRMGEALKAAAGGAQ